MKINFPNNLASSFLKENGFGEEATAIRTTQIVKWDRPFKTSVKKGYLIELLMREDLLDNFIATHWPVGNEIEGKETIDFLLKLKDEYNIFLERLETEEEQEEQGEQNESSLKFALENHLRDFLAKNLDIIESGLTLYVDNIRTGVEFPLDGGRIDILAIDANRRPVVIELKLSQGRNKVLGQILYYMSWIDKNLGLGSSRGIIIANEIYPELQLAVARAPGVQLAAYKMQFSIEKIPVY